MSTPELTAGDINYVWHHRVRYNQAKDACLPTVTRSIIAMVEGEDVTQSPEEMILQLSREEREDSFSPYGGIVSTRPSSAMNVDYSPHVV
jgi:hypothetical protein